jgi:cytoskeletal protein RodZ
LTIIGEKLKEAREAKGYSIEHVSRETNIARRYIEALEEGDFSQFPAEAYLIGFLKNYGEYLSLNGKELQAQYRMHKIQEQPIPVEQLLKSPSAAPKVAITVIICLFTAGLAAGMVFFILNRTAKQDAVAETRRSLAVYELAEGIMEQRFYYGDTLKITNTNPEWAVGLRKIGEIITLTAPGGDILLGLNDIASADVNGDGLTDLNISVPDFQPNKPEMGALLRFELTEAVPSVETAAAVESAPVAEAVQPAPTAPVGASQAIFTGNTPYPFTLQVRFQGYCMLRWEVLREANQGRSERYFGKGEVMDIQAQNGIRLWISNAAAIKGQVIGGGRTVAVDFGGPGEVIVVDINWVRDTDGCYKLIQNRLEN